MTDHPSNEADAAPEGAASHSAGAGDSGGEERFDLESLWKLVEDGLPPATDDPFLGDVVGGVRLVRVIGEGGMGRVYEGLQEHPARTVAVKLQRPGRLERESTKRFLRELGILGRLSHPALCHVFHAGFLPCGGERLPWFVMEYVPDAMPINRFVESQRVPLRRRLGLFREVCAGVAAAHAAGVVHRDIKAGNILVGAEGRPKVIDFGVATAFRGDLHATSLTRAGQIVGTIESIAPELLAPDPPVESPRSDVWSLGVVLHELVTGSSPFRIEDGSVVAAIERIRSHRPALAARCASGPGRAIGAIVDKALAPQAADRHADADALAAELTAILERFPQDHPGWGAGGHLALGTAPREKRRWAWGALGAMGLVAAMVPVLLPPRHRESASAPVASVPVAERRESSPVFDPPAFSTSPIERADFRHAVRDVDDPEAEQYLIEAVGVRKWHEDFGQRFSYWGPEDFGVEGRLVYRYDFPRPSRRIHLKAEVSCRAQSLEEGIIGDGACALEYSKDGREWRPLINTIEPRIYGAIVQFEELLPDEACGSASLWLRVRLLAEGPWKRADYSVAQFLRRRPFDTATTFELEVECEPVGVGSSASPSPSTLPERGASSPTLDPPAISTSPIGRVDFRHTVRNVDDPEAERYLVEAVGVRKWYEDFGHRERYWGPDAFGVEGRLVYRYDFPRPSRRIHVRTDVCCFSQLLEGGVIGNGAFALEYSRDGRTWRPIVNYLEPRIWGVGALVDDPLPDDACGSRSLWLRVRLLSVGPWKESDYALAQFLRRHMEDVSIAHEVVVECEPEGVGHAASPISD